MTSESPLIALARQDATRLAAERPDAGGSAVGLDAASSLNPDSIPRYRLVRELHRGSQGVVYEARHLPTGRNVALKIIRTGPLAGRRAAARFEREIRILAHLTHPGIVAIHDGGVCDGWLYLAMDLVEGRPLDGWAAHVRSEGSTRTASRAALRALLRVFAGICDAVDAAHVRGVIHRDLKPANILVTDGEVSGFRVQGSGRAEDGRAGVLNPEPRTLSPQARILDFGLAKLLEDEPDTHDASATHLGQFVGSLPWASPEQAEGAHDRIDTRSDVYSLGVILFHMLTGAFPYDVGGSLRTILDTIVCAEPRRPSGVARGSQSGALHCTIDDEVDTIVLKCLNKTPQRRYGTAGELARDVRRYLAGEPIEAKKDSRWYMLRKTLHRYRALAASSGLLLLLLAILLAASYLLWRRAEVARMLAIDAEHHAVDARQRAMVAAEQAEEHRLRAEAALATEAELRVKNDQQTALLQQERDRALEAERRESEQRTRASEAERQARSERERAETEAQRARNEVQKAEAVRSFIEKDLLAAADPHKDARRTVTVGEVLDQAAQQIDAGAMNDHPEVEARLREAVGQAYQGMNRHDEAVRQLTASLAERRERLGNAHPSTLRTMSQLAVSLLAAGRRAEAEQLQREAVEGTRQTLGPDHLELGQALLALALTLRTSNEQDREAEAAPMVAESLRIARAAHGEEHVATAEAMAAHAWSLRRRNDFDGAAALMERVIEIREKVLGPESTPYAYALTELGWLRLQTTRHDEATALFSRALEIAVTTSGDASPEALQFRAARASGLQYSDRFDEAETEYRRILEIQTTLGAPDKDIAVTLQNYAWTLHRLGRSDEAEAMLRDGLDRHERADPADELQAAVYRQSLAGFLMQTERVAEARPLLIEAVRVWRERRGDANEFTQNAIRQLMAVHASLGEADEAAALSELLAPK